MNAKEFNKIWQNIKGPTDKKILNAAKRAGLKDTYNNLLDYFPVFLTKEMAKKLNFIKEV